METNLGKGGAERREASWRGDVRINKAGIEVAESETWYKNKEIIIGD